MTGPDSMERPVKLQNAHAGWGSDIVAEILHQLKLPFISLNPGASYRGLHDSLVNYLGNHEPQIILCLHEEHAVAVAHGYAKVTGRPMAVALHSNVGLLHGSMAVFNAWCDRVPVIILGATGPVDAAKRRPWIDWIHTSKDQGAILRNFVKWDDQPASPAAAIESLLRGNQIAQTIPHGPVYICLDTELQENALSGEIALPDYTRFAPAAPSRPAAECVKRAAQWLREAKKPVILAGRGARTIESWRARVALAEYLGATVLTDLKSGAAFPTDHPLHPVPPFNFLNKEGTAIVRGADLLLSLDSIDLGGIISQAFGDIAPRCRVISASLDIHSHNGWGMEHQALPPVDLTLLSDPDEAVSCLLDALQVSSQPKVYKPKPSPTHHRHGTVDLMATAEQLRHTVGDNPVTFATLPRGWPLDIWPFRHPLDYLGKDGGSGLGSGPGLAVGAALALRDSNRLVISVLGDGDCSMGMSALWTAAHYRLPLLILVANNRSYFNDELHQEGIARERGRPAENRWIGQRMIDPDIDFAKLAEAQGLVGYGPVSTPEDLARCIAAAVSDVRRGMPALVDIRIAMGEERNMNEAMQHRSA